MDIGSEGLQEVNLFIPQSTSLAFDVAVKDEETREIIDLSGSSIHMRFQYKSKKVDVDQVLDSCCTYSDGKIHVFIPGSISGSLPIGKLNWDIIVDTQFGETVRVCYGDVTIYDTYAKDEV